MTDTTTTGVVMASSCRADSSTNSMEMSLIFCAGGGRRRQQTKIQKRLNHVGPVLTLFRSRHRSSGISVEGILHSAPAAPPARHRAAASAARQAQVRTGFMCGVCVCVSVCIVHSKIGNREQKNTPLVVLESSCSRPARLRHRITHPSTNTKDYTDTNTQSRDTNTDIQHTHTKHIPHTHTQRQYLA